MKKRYQIDKQRAVQKFRRLATEENPTIQMMLPLAGIVRMGFARFLVFTGAGGLIWAGVFVGLGWLFSRQLELVASYAMRLGSGLVALLASVAFITTAHAQMPTSPWKKGAPFPVRPLFYYQRMRLFKSFRLPL